MDFSPQTRRKRGEPIVPMINIVFLLLIFFMMSAAIAPPDPFAVQPPDADIEAEALPPETLFVGADGALAFETARGDGVYAAIAATAPEVLTIRADGQVPAADIAAMLPRLAEAGVARFSLVAVLP